MTVAGTENGASLAKSIVGPFVSAASEMFSTMVGVTIAVEKPFLKTPGNPRHDVCGIIGFSGEVTGTVVLGFCAATAQALVEKFAGTRLELSDSDFADAVGEMANMVAGGAKKRLGVKASISVPSVVVGEGYTLAGMSTMSCVVLPCTSAVGNFAIEVAIKQTKG